MADPLVQDAQRLFTGTAGSTALKAGDLAYFDGTDWELADADDETKFAEALVVSTVASGEIVGLCREGRVEDPDAPYTQGATHYLSATAGAFTSTRPTGANNLIQVIGFSLSTSLVDVVLNVPYEFHVSLKPMTDGTAAYIQNKDYTGVALAAAGHAAGYTCMVPQNAISLVIAYLWWTSLAAGAALDASDTYTIDVSSGVDDETITATSDGITAASLAVASDDLNSVDISAAFNTAGIIQPGNVLGIDADKAAEGSGCDDPVVLVCHLVFLCV